MDIAFHSNEVVEEMRLEELLQRIEELLPMLQEYEVEIIVGVVLISVGIIMLVKLYGKIKRGRSPWS